MRARFPLLVLIAVVCIAYPARGDEEVKGAPQGAAQPSSEITWTYDPGGLLRGAVANRAKIKQVLLVAAGTVFTTENGGTVITLQKARLAVPAGSNGEVDVPAVILSHKGKPVSGTCEVTAHREPRVEPLLRWLEDRTDVPRPTSQLAVLALTENITLAGWDKFLQEQRPKSEKIALSPAQIVQAVDALGILKAIAPAGQFALLKDGELKLRALRNPWCRTKAMQLYGLTVPELGSAQAPDLGQLLHTKANDNCPVCRLRGSPPGGAGSL